MSICNNCHSLMKISSSSEFDKQFLDKNSQDNTNNIYKFICNICRTKEPIKKETILYKTSNISNDFLDKHLMYNERLLKTKRLCEECKKETTFTFNSIKNNNIILKHKIKCDECDVIYKNKII